ncbi:MAG: hypothetical protein HFJ29_00945 [Clostridia bacterium]|nr:hypothetical protein [Clostridia bacterium]
MSIDRKKQIRVANKVIKELKHKGFKINQYYAKTTRSIYLKIDYGVCGGIRISDHRGKKKYRYNLIEQYKGPKQINDRGYIRMFYDYDNTEKLISDIQNEKKLKIYKYGIYNYQSYMKKNSMDNLYKTFKNVA